MKVLIADDDVSMLRLVDALMVASGYDTVKVQNGEDAWKIMTETESLVAILDWKMPGVTGIELCRRLASIACDSWPFVILLTAMNDSKSVLEGLEAGADDYITKPFDREVLKARVKIGARIIGQRQKLTHRVRELEKGLLSIAVQ